MQLCYVRLEKKQHYSARRHAKYSNIQGGPKSKPLPNDQKIVLNRIKDCQ